MKFAKGQLFAIYTVLMFAYKIKAEVFSSTARLERLFKSTNTVSGAIHDYIKVEEARLEAIKRIMLEISEMSAIKLGANLSVVEHPIGAFHAVKKYALLSDEISRSATNEKSLQESLSRTGITLPLKADYDGSLAALLRLQKIYKLKTWDIMAGNVSELHIAPLTQEDAFNMAETAKIQKFFIHAIEWYDVVLHVEDPDRYQTFERRKLAAIQLADIYLMYNDFTNAMEFSNWAKTAYPDDEAVQQSHKLTHEKVELYRTNADIPAPVAAEVVDETYAALCRGDPEAINPSVAIHGHCISPRTSVPYQLVKQEILSYEPFISVFYDVLQESEAEAFKREAQQTLYRALVGDPAAGVVSDVRVGQLTWLDDKTPMMKKISDRIMSLTGLDVTMRDLLSSSEPFQVIVNNWAKFKPNTELQSLKTQYASVEKLLKRPSKKVKKVVNYGIGGHYDPHVDVYDNKTVLKDIPDFLKNTGDRIATFLFYLDDVEEGGATVFPKARIRVPVVKYGAAFWYNLHRNGDNDAMTLHAGCPVLLGQKWVANKWIRERGQEFRHGCGLAPHTPHHQPLSSS